MNLLITRVKVEILNILAGNMSIVLDGWTHEDTHYLAVYANINHFGRQNFIMNVHKNHLFWLCSLF